MMRAESIATIADFITSVFKYGYNGCDMAFSENTKQVIFKNCKIFADEKTDFCDIVSVENVFNILTQMNYSAVNQRYKEHDFDTEPFINNYTRFKRPINYNNGIFEIPTSYYQLLKTIDCYLYQCSEGNVPESALYKAVQSIRNTLANWIISNTPAFNAAEWG